MHDEITNYLFSLIDDWEGSDDYGFSFARVDTDNFIWDVSDIAPEDLQNRSQESVARYVAEYYGARHLILHWSHTGARTVHPMPSYRHAVEAYDNLMSDWEDWSELADY